MATHVASVLDRVFELSPSDLRRWDAGYTDCKQEAAHVRKLEAFERSCSRPHGIVYLLANMRTGECYVGATSSMLEKRWRQHKVTAFVQRKSGRLYDAIRKYGPEAFSVTYLASSLSLNELAALEGELIAQIQPKYNKVLVPEDIWGVRHA